MKKILLTTLLVFGVTLSGCTPGTPAEDNYVEAELIPSLNTSKEGNYKIRLKYDDNFFLTDAKEYNQELSELSFGAAATASTKEITTKFFRDCQFSDINPVGYDETPTVNSVAYAFAHRTVKEYEVIAASFRWFDYQQEWVNNFTVGKTGDHEGFTARANEIYAALQTYISQHLNGKKLKLWFSGYSRGGGIANVLSNIILKGEEISIEQSDMYVYTFEAPRGVDVNNAVECKNVHNLVNSGDIIPQFAPAEYGLVRCGVDHEIYSYYLPSLMKEFDPQVEIPDFVAVTDMDEGLINDSALVSYFLKEALKYEYGDDPTYSLKTREQFVDNYQSAVSYCIGVVFTLSDSVKSEIIADISTKGFLEILGIIADGQSAFNYLKPFLDKDGYQYVEADMIANLGVMIKFVMGPFMNVALIAISPDYKGDMTRLIDAHYPESVYCLLRNYHSSFKLWNDCESLATLKSYVEDVTNPKSRNYIPKEDRIATFDMDGTFIGELYPTYFEYNLLEYRGLDDPTYTEKDPSVVAAAQNIRDFVRNGTPLPDHFDMVHARAAAKAYAGMSVAEFDSYVKEYAKKPANGFEGMTYAESFYKPMLEVFDYLDKYDFTCYVVSGSDRFICRSLVESIGIQPNRVIGMDVVLKASNQGDNDGVDYTMNSDEHLIRTDELIIKNLKTNKVKQISQEIGKIPVLSFGNSSGDSAMHNYCKSNDKYKTEVFMLIADDYDDDHADETETNKRKAAWEAAHYNIISMKNDFRTIYGYNVKKTNFIFD